MNYIAIATFQIRGKIQEEKEEGRKIKLIYLNLDKTTFTKMIKIKKIHQIKILYNYEVRSKSLRGCPLELTDRDDCRGTPFDSFGSNSRYLSPISNCPKSII